MRVVTWWAVFAAGFLIAAPSFGQTLPPVPSVNAPELSACGPVPYSVGEAVNSLELSGRIGLSAIDALAGVPDVEGAGGRRVIRTAYAGMRHQAMSAVFDSLGCRIIAHLRQQNSPDAQDKILQVQNAIASLQMQMGNIQGAIDEGFAARTELTNAYAASQRISGAPTLEATITSAALSDIDPEQLFINQTIRERWGNLSFGEIVSVGGCQVVVRAALSDGTSSLQRSLADTKSILISYLDPNIPQSISFAKLYSTLSGNPTGGSAVSSATLRSCAQTARDTNVNLDGAANR